MSCAREPQPVVGPYHREDGEDQSRRRLWQKDNRSAFGQLAGCSACRDHADYDDRVIQLAHAMIAELNELDNCAVHIARVKRELINKFSDILATEFHEVRNDEVRFANEIFAAEVTAVQDYRKRLRKAVEDTPGASVSDVVASDASSSCVIS